MIRQHMSLRTQPVARGECHGHGARDQWTSMRAEPTPEQLRDDGSLDGVPLISIEDHYRQFMRSLDERAIEAEKAGECGPGSHRAGKCCVTCFVAGKKYSSIRLAAEHHKVDPTRVRQFLEKYPAVLVGGTVFSRENDTTKVHIPKRTRNSPGPHAGRRA